MVSKTTLEFPCRDNTEAFSLSTSSKCGLDLMQSSIECTSRSDMQRSYPPSKNAAGASASGAEAANPTAPTKDQPKILKILFDVSRTSQYPGRFELSIAAYKQWQSELIKQAKEKNKSKFFYLTVVRLREMGVHEIDLEMVAGEVMEGKEVELFAIPSEGLYEYYRDWNTVESYQCLLISSPKSNWSSNQLKEIADNFCIQAFPEEHYSAERISNTIDYREVVNSTQIREYVQEFFRISLGIRAKNAIYATIVVFGHGDFAGLLFYEKTPDICSESMHLDDIISLVEEEWKQARLEYPPELPVMVEIIFTQCFGHVHRQIVQSDRFRVTALTTAEHFRTVGIRDANRKWYNVNLKRYAEGTLRLQALEMETWRKPSAPSATSTAEDSGIAVDESMDVD